MFTEGKVTELSCMADDFCKFFDVVRQRHTLKPVSYTHLTLPTKA